MTGAEIFLALVGLVLAGGAVGLALAIRELRAQGPGSSPEVRRADAPEGVPTTTLERLAACESRLDSLFQLRVEWGAVMEEIEDQLQTVERKRRRAAASAAKALPGFDPAPAADVPDIQIGDDRASLRRRALAAGRL